MPADPLSPPQDADPIRRARAFMRLLRSPRGCAWDREQTHESLAPALLEEAYEAVEALRSGDEADFREELGDVLLQVLFQAQIAEEAGRFTFDDVVGDLNAKLLRRHPHVFGAVDASNPEEAIQSWNEIKAQEKAARAARLGEAAVQKGTLTGLGKGLTALQRTDKIKAAAARLGFDSPTVEESFLIVREEAEEVAAEIGGDQEKLAEEIGDLFFAVAQFARKAGFDSELLAARANEKFIRRFTAMEAEMERRHAAMNGQNIAEMDAVWQQVKRQLKKQD